MATQTTSISPEFINYLTNILGINQNFLSKYIDENGNFVGDISELVAPLARQQIEGLDAQSGLARNALEGTGIYDTEAATQRALANLQGQQLAGATQGGVLNSARQDRATQAALADMGYQFQKDRQAVAEGGAQSLQDVGSVYQEQRQRESDMPTNLISQGTQNIGNLLGTQTQTKTDDDSLTWVCSKMYHLGHWSPLKIAKLRKWHMAKSKTWHRGYDVWGKLVAKYLVNDSTASFAEAFYDAHVAKKGVTLKSIIADIVMSPAYVIGLFSNKEFKSFTIADAKQVRG